MFTIFVIVAAWQLPLEHWLQVCITVFGIVNLLLGPAVRIALDRNDD